MRTAGLASRRLRHRLKYYCAPSARRERAPAQERCVLYARPGHRLWTRGSALCVRRQALLKAVFSAHVATGLTEAAEDGARGRTQRRARAHDWLGPSYRQIPRCMKCWLAKAASSSSRHRRVRARPAFRRPCSLGGVFGPSSSSHTWSRGGPHVLKLPPHMVVRDRLWGSGARSDADHQCQSTLG